jgi:hypothetical protein
LTRLMFTDGTIHYRRIAYMLEIVGEAISRCHVEQERAMRNDASGIRFSLLVATDVCCRFRAFALRPLEFFVFSFIERVWLSMRMERHLSHG